jgi:alpha-beta hydrolase superfamily lysophospholipase
MRFALLAALLVFSGCAAPAPPVDPADRGLQASDIQLPEGAVLEPIPGGFAAAWKSQSLPFTVKVTVPEYATMVRAVAEAPAGTRIGIVNDETGRRRCNTPTVENFGVPYSSPVSCSSFTALDEPGAVWRITVTGSGAAKLRVEFLDVRPDGLVGQLDLSLIDPPTRALQPTQVIFVPSWDGALLRVEVTLPEGPGPWPTIIESSPYHDDGLRATPSSWNYFVHDWARRGYAIVTADVRGFGDSGGCVEVWGPNEQKDQAYLVEWAAKQAWSDGNIGFYGQSYVGTTPVEAASLAPPNLKAIITVAPVISAYEDWHHGGVPNGENLLSPVAYQALQDRNPPQRNDPETLARNSANGLCDPTLAARANDPRAVYDAFYEERDFKRMAGNIKAAVLYTQGFEDANVKSTMIPGWFNEINAPKLGLFGHWLHQHPPRADSEALFVGWMEEHLKGKRLGFERLPAVAVTADRERHRVADAWPPVEPETVTLWPDFSALGLASEPAPGSATVRMDSTGQLTNARLELSQDLAQPVALAGVAHVHVVGRLLGTVGYLTAELHEEKDGHRRLISWGQFHLGHNADHTEFSPRTPSELITVELPIRPTEHVFEGRMVLVLRGATFTQTLSPLGAASLDFTFHGGEDGTRLVLPTVPVASYASMPLSARP